MSLHTWDGRRSLAVVEGREEPARMNSFLHDNPQLHDSLARTQRRTLGSDRLLELAVGVGLLVLCFGPYLGFIAFLALTR
jgi:hypothetical protein